MALLKRRRAGLGDAMDVVTRFVNACNRHDAEGIYACLHPDFDSIQPMYPSRNFRGADQVRRNWQAIFDAEPGFRLTVLRSAQMDDTVWLELHGAGQDAEVAGVFVMGIVGDRIRWARIYSALVEPVPAGMGEAAAGPGLRQVPPSGAPAPTDSGEVVEESLIAPVLDIERSTRRRRRRHAEEKAADATATAEEAEPEAQPAQDPDATAAVDVIAEPAAEAEAEAEAEASEPVVVEPADQEPVADAEPVVVVEPVDVVVPEQTEAAEADAGPDTEAVLIQWDEDETDLFDRPQTTPEPAPEGETDDNAPTSKRRFGKKPRS